MDHCNHNTKKNTHPYVQSKILTAFGENIPQMLITSATEKIPCNTRNPHTILKIITILRSQRISSEVSLFNTQQIQIVFG